MKSHTKKGFTLIEIMVVVGIIGVLTAVVTANFTEARREARNKSLRASLSEVQLALEVYRAQNDRYPASISLLLPEYIHALPDNGSTGNTSCDVDNSRYTTDAGGTYYKLTAYRCIAGATSAANGIQQDDELARCPSFCGSCGGVTFNAAYKASADFYESMAIYSRDGECQ